MYTQFTAMSEFTVQLAVRFQCNPLRLVQGVKMHSGLDWVYWVQCRIEGLKETKRVVREVRYEEHGDTGPCEFAFMGLWG